MAYGGLILIWAGSFQAWFAAHRALLWPSALAAVLLAVLSWWAYLLYKNRLVTLSGIVTVDGQLLPKFRIDMHQGTASPYNWQLQQECSNGCYAVYSVPTGQVVVEFSWGTSDSCKMVATVDTKRKRNLLDIAVSLDLDNLNIQKSLAGGVASSAVTWAFQKPKAEPSPTKFEILQLKYLYKVSHEYLDTSRSLASGSNSETGWTYNGRVWDAKDTVGGYSPSPDAETWSVEAYVDGFPSAKKVTKRKQ